MEADTIRKYEGKKVTIVLKNKHEYTLVIPSFEGNTLSAKTIYDEDLDVSCDFIDFIKGPKGEPSSNKPKASHLPTRRAKW